MEELSTYALLMTSLVALDLIIKTTFNQKSLLEKNVNSGKTKYSSSSLGIFFMAHPIPCLQYGCSIRNRRVILRCALKQQFIESFPKSIFF